MYLRKELGDGTIRVMKTLKNALDPRGIMNPGKVSDRVQWGCDRKDCVKMSSVGVVTKKWRIKGKRSKGSKLREESEL